MRISQRRPSKVPTDGQDFSPLTMWLVVLAALTLGAAIVTLVVSVVGT
jgi:hypothetical protein